MVNRYRILVAAPLAGLALAGMARPAFTAPRKGQDAPPVQAANAQPPTALAPEPQRTSASYGDWVVRCDRTGGKKACEAVQTFTIKGREAPFAQVAFVQSGAKADAKADGASGMAMLLLLPVNVSFDKQPTLTIAGNEGSALPFKLLRCLPEGCVASLTMANDSLGGLRSAPSSQAAFVDAAGQRISLPLSVKGLTLALDALVKETASN